MTSFTKDVEAKVRQLGMSLKLQMAFLASADMNERLDQLKNVEMNAKTASLMIEVVRALNITGQTDADVMGEIVKITEENGSDAAKDLKPLVEKVRSINADFRVLFQEKVSQKQKPNGDDFNRIFRKHLAR